MVSSSTDVAHIISNGGRYSKNFYFSFGGLSSVIEVVKRERSLHRLFLLRFKIIASFVLNIIYDLNYSL